MGGRGDRSAAEHVVVEDVEEVVELQGHLQSLSHVTPTSSETSKRQSTYRPRTGMRARISGGVGRRRGMRARLSGFGLSPAATIANAQGGRGRLMSAKMQHVMGELVDEGE